MRIVGGNWRGRRLAELGEGDPIAHLRPSSDRFRETVFNILSHNKYEHAPQNMRVLDLFAGTGALSFEALSRGASFATLVDNGVKAGTLIQKNREALSCVQKTQFIRRNATDLGSCKDEPFDLIFLDPPYGQSRGEKAIKCAMEGGWLALNSLVVWEEELVPRLPKELKQMDQRKIGRAILTIARFEGS